MTSSSSSSSDARLATLRLRFEAGVLGRGLLAPLVGVAGAIEAPPTENFLLDFLILKKCSWTALRVGASPNSLAVFC